jgi:hypothetical protein
MGVAAFTMEEYSHYKGATASAVVMLPRKNTEKHEIFAVNRKMGCWRSIYN